MANKKVWITALNKDEGRISQFNSALRRYGFDLKGHIWLDENDKLAWRVAADEFLSTGAEYWFILADQTTLSKPSIRYGINLMASCLENKKQGAVPIFIFGKELLSELLPAQLRGAIMLDDADLGWEAKVVTKTLRLPSPALPSYHFDGFGTEHVGQWFELGPIGADEVWKGLIFAVSGVDAEIVFQAVGPSGLLPQKTTLNFPRQGLKMKVGERDYLGWSLQNLISANESYYAKVTGSPTSLLFIPNEGAVESDSVEAFTIHLN
jgi:hypothetical protein